MEILIYALIIFGILISFLNLPGPWIIFIATLFASSSFDIKPSTYAIFIFLAVFASIVDNLLVILGAKKFGGGKWGMIGAVVGLIVGILIGNLAGGILGPFFGAFLFEYLIAKKPSDIAFKAGLGTVVGLLGSILMKVVITIGMSLTLISIIS
ncbi:DUF456 domain-containing protein [Candidatus Dojkabacteria bacterium]|nr:DUF456 domain-containing protein [Candidatus Dojkabacteria bacterium]